MKHTPIGPAPNRQETLNGFGYLAFQLLLLPTILTWCNARLSSPMNEAELNFVFYLINFIAMLLIFHSYLDKNLSDALHHPIYLCQAVILGLAAYFVSLFAVSALVVLLVPGYSNYNDEAIAAMTGSNSFLMLIGTVVLVPPVEECFFRGLIFRNLYSKNKWAAYAVSILTFACLHILGYIGLYSPVEILMAVLQYLPAGVWLAWAYTKSGTIFAPIAMHAAINYLTIRTLR